MWHASSESFKSDILASETELLLLIIAQIRNEISCTLIEGQGLLQTYEQLQALHGDKET